MRYFLILIVFILFIISWIQKTEWDKEREIFIHKTIPILPWGKNDIEALLTDKEDIKYYARSKINSEKQWKCLDKLWEKESGWRTHAKNKHSSAYGIPQALPGKKMKKSWGDYLQNPKTQIKWGLEYIKDRYSTPCIAWKHSILFNWY